MKDQLRRKPSKVTKTLVNKIHGGRKQDSKFWQSEFPETNREPVIKRADKKGDFTESFTLFVLFFLAIGIVSYGGFYLYKRYYAEFSKPEPPIEQITTKSPAAGIDDRPITQKELDRAIQKALAKKLRNEQRYTAPAMTNFYYRVELVNGGKIEAESATRDGDLFTIKDRKGLVFSVNRKEIKNVKKIQI